MNARLYLALALILAACSGSAPRPERPEPEPAPEPEPVVTSPAEPEGPVVPEDTSSPEGGSVCTRTTDCDSGLACRGAPGCTSEWACGEPRECGAERVAYCDCEGVTFYAPSGCAGRAYLHVGPCEDTTFAEAVSLGIPDGDEPITSEDRTCASSSECPRWQMCFGAQGCGTDWRCERVRGCSRRRVEFCGCDGRTFTASEDCPGQPFTRRGACDEAVAVAPTTTTRPTTTTARPTTTTRPTTTATTTTATPLAPGACATNRDCARGEVCTGAPGCGMTWTCERPPEPCLRDTQVFCDCEGNTFRASMTCPGRPHAHRGSCEIDRMLELSGAALR